MPRVYALVFLLAACDFYPEAPGLNGDPTPTPSGDPSCSLTIVAPPAVNPDQEFPAAQEHEEIFGSGPEPWQIHLSWPGRDTSRSVAFLWRTDTDTLATQVELTAENEAPQILTGGSFTWGGPESMNYRMHEVKVCGGLTPGTVYSYRVGGEGHWSEEFQFTTPLAPRSFDHVRMAFAGDSRGAYGVWGTILDAMLTHAPDVIAFNGDMVEAGSNQGEWDSWFQAGERDLAAQVLVPTLGNHEFLSRNYFAAFSLPGNEEWFSVDYGNVQILSLNDMTTREPTDISVAEATFIEQELAASDATWKVAIHHWSPYSACTTHRSNMNVREAWPAIFDRHDLDLSVGGHNHIYERSVPIRDGVQVASGEGTVYLTTGGAGAPLYFNSDEQWFNEVANPIVHYIIVDFGPSEAQFVVRDLDGNIIDEFTIEK